MLVQGAVYRDRGGMDPPVFSRSLPHLNVILFVVPFVVHATDGLVERYCCSSGGPATRELYRAQELYENRGGRPGLSPSLIVLTVSEDVRQH